LPNVGPYIYDVSISGFTRSSIYIYDISSLRVNMVQQVSWPYYITGKLQQFCVFYLNNDHQYSQQLSYNKSNFQGVRTHENSRIITEFFNDDIVL